MVATTRRAPQAGVMIAFAFIAVSTGLLSNHRQRDVWRFCMSHGEKKKSGSRRATADGAAEDAIMQVAMRRTGCEQRLQVLAAAAA